MDKKSARAAAKEISERLSGDYVAEASAAIEEKVISSDIFKRAKTVFVYIGMAREPKTVGIIKTALESGKTVLVPKCVSPGEMIAVRIEGLDELAYSCYGIMEPVVPLEYEGDIDLAIVPCAAAGADGRRLGHGMGYYDRFLAEYDCKTICLCFSKLLFEDIPAEEHDILMDTVVTETA